MLAASKGNPHGFGVKVGDFGLARRAKAAASAVDPNGYGVWGTRGVC